MVRGAVICNQPSQIVSFSQDCVRLQGMVGDIYCDQEIVRDVREIMHVNMREIVGEITPERLRDGVRDDTREI